MMWRIKIENETPIPQIGPEVINPYTGHPDHQVLYESITLLGTIEGTIEFHTNPKEEDSGTLILDSDKGQVRIPMHITQWVRRCP